MDIQKSSDPKQPKSFGYNPVMTGAFLLSMLVIGGVSYLWGKKDNKDLLLQEFNKKTSRVTLLNNRIKLLEFEITELPEGAKTKIEKEIEIDTIRQTISQIETSLVEISNDLNMMQRK